MRRAVLQVTACMLWSIGLAVLFLAAVYPPLSDRAVPAAQVVAYALTVVPLLLAIRPRPPLPLGRVRLAAAVGGALIAAAVVLQAAIGASAAEGVAHATTAVSAGVGEEVLFRGLLRSRIELLVRGPVVVVVVDALLFALYHLPVVLLHGEPLWSVAVPFLFGAVFAVLRTASGGLLLPAAVHVAVDLSS